MLNTNTEHEVERAEQQNMLIDNSDESASAEDEHSEDGIITQTNF